MKALIRVVDPKVARIAITKLYRMRHTPGYIVYDLWQRAPVTEDGRALLSIGCRPMARYKAEDQIIELVKASPLRCAARYSVVWWPDYCKLEIRAMVSAIRNQKVTK